MNADALNRLRLAADMPAIAELRAHRQWVAWRYKDVTRADGTAGQTKPPICPLNGGGASHSKPETWGSFEQARVFAMTRKLPGVGFVLSEEDEFTGIDLDKCRNKETGEVDAWAKAVLSMAETYAEVSPSGTGIRLIARGKVEAATKCDPAHVEIYGKQRYLTITADHIPGTPTSIQPAPQTIAYLKARAAEFQAKAAEQAAAARPEPETPHRPATDDEKLAPFLRNRPSRAKPDAPKQAKEQAGKSFFRAVNDAAMERLDSWFPALFPSAKAQSGTGGWRVSSKDLGRTLEEDLSAVPGAQGGITDFGVHDMGDARQGKRTPISLVQEWGGKSDVRAAAHWLCDQMGVDPLELGWELRGADESANATMAQDEREEGAQTAGARTSEAEAKSDPRSSGQRNNPLASVTFDGDEDPKPPKYQVDGLFCHRELVLLAGPSGAGKSFVMIDLAAALATGGIFFDKQAFEVGGVAILAAEGAGTMAPRIAAVRNAKLGGEILPIAWIRDVPRPCDTARRG